MNPQSHSRNQFFFCLPTEQQLRLLRETEMSASTEIATKLAEKVNVPVEKIHPWLLSRCKQIRELHSQTKSKLTPRQVSILKQEFTLQEERSPDDCLLWSYVINVPASYIYQWFNKRRAQLQGLDKPKNEAISLPPISSTVTIPLKPFSEVIHPTIKENEKNLKVKNEVDTKEQEFQKAKPENRIRFSPTQSTILFNAYMKNSLLNSDEVTSLAENTSLSNQQVKGWFKGMKGKVGNAKLSTLEKFVSKGYTQVQIAGLEKKYTQSKYISEEEIDQLSVELGLTSMCTSQWFQKRRLKELKLKSQKKEEDKNVEIVDKVNNDELATHVKESSYADPKSTLIVDEKTHAVCENLRDDENRSSTKISSDDDDDAAFWNKKIKLEGRTRNPKSREPSPIQVHKSNAIKEKPSKISKLANVSLSKKLESKKSSSNKNAKTIQQHKMLFGEFKKSSELTESRLNSMSKKIRLDAKAIKQWFIDVSKRLSLRTKENTEQVLTQGFEKNQLQQLIKEYSVCRYYSPEHLEVLADKVNLPKTSVQNWFVNARYYELLTGERFKCDFTKKVIPASVVINKESHSEKNVEDQTENISLPESLIEELKNRIAVCTDFTDHNINDLAKSFGAESKNIKTWLRNYRKVDESEKLNSTEASPSSAVTEKLATDDKLEQIRAFRICLPVLDTSRYNFFEPSVSTAVSCSTPAPVSIPASQKKRKFPAQQEALFRAYKESPQLDSDRLSTLKNKYDLSSNQITSWFSWMKKKLTMLPSDILIESYRNDKLTSDQVKMLESEYSVQAYPEELVLQHIANYIGCSRKFIKTWFANRRFYDILDSNTKHENSNHEIFGNLFTVISDNNEAPEPEVPVLFEDHELPQFPPEEYRERSRYIEKLSNDLDLNTSINDLFWYMRSNVNNDELQGSVYLSESDIVVLEGLFQKNSQPSLEDMEKYAQRLRVSEQTVYWWFVQQRCRKNETFSVQRDDVRLVNVEAIKCGVSNDNTRNENPMANDDDIGLGTTDCNVVNLDSDDEKSVWSGDDSTEIDHAISNILPTVSNLCQPVLDEPSSDLTESSHTGETPEPLELLNMTESFPFVNSSSDSTELSNMTESFPVVNPSSDSKDLSNMIESLPLVKSSLDSTELSNISEFCSDPTTFPTEDVIKKNNNGTTARKTILTAHQRLILKTEFRKSSKLSKCTAKKLAIDLGLSVKFIASWFGKRNRAKVNKQRFVKEDNEFTSEQYETLEQEFAKNPSLSKSRCGELAANLNLQRRKIFLWFRNRSASGSIPNNHSS